MDSAAQPSRLPYKGHRLGRLILTTCRNATGAPWEFGGKRVSEESALALLSLHDYLNDLERSLDADA